MKYVVSVDSRKFGRFATKRLMLGIFSLFLGAAAAQAGDLRSPFDFESVAVLPKGVRNPRFKNLIMYMDERFGGNGGIEPLGNKLNKPVSWRDVIDGQDDATLKAVTQGKVQQLGFALDDTAGSTSGVVNTYVNAKVPVMAVGVTEKLTMALAVPVMTIQVNADTGLQKSAQADQLIESVASNDPYKGDESARKLNDAVNTKLKRLGYDPIESYTKTAIGDIKAVGKYQLWNGERDGFALRGEVTAPTGTKPNVNKALDTPTGDGQWDIGAGAIYDLYLTRDHLFRANFYSGYTVQLPDHLERRLPVSDMDSLSSDKELLYRDLGDFFSTGASLIHEAPFGLVASVGYNFQRMFETKFEGSKFNPYRYSLLEAGTSQMLHSAVFGLGFSTVEMYRNHQFKAPFQVNVAYSRPLAGMNVVRNGFMSFELVLFF